MNHLTNNKELNERQSKLAYSIATIRTIRKIKKGEELFVAYGNNYWKRLGDISKGTVNNPIVVNGIQGGTTSGIVSKNEVNCMQNVRNLENFQVILNAISEAIKQIHVNSRQKSSSEQKAAG